ncbi:MAG: hypothetical protein NT018_10865 [Armatimonadetes bacterium]|nr:hypothetical protein [Armatimonadota bacterium]
MQKSIISLALCFLVVAASAAKLVDAQKPEALPWLQSELPAGCPFKQSEVIKQVLFTGRHAEYTKADTWYPSWASDGNMYSPFTDGSVNGLRSGSFGETATTGNAKIVGDDPLNLSIVDQGVFVSSSLPYGGRYPCGSLVYNGVWYYGTYCLDNEKEPGYNWGIMGPFVGFRYSTDFGKTWTQTPHTPSKPLFPEPKQQDGKVKFGSPHFVDFGKNMQYSTDGKAYLVAHGASDPDPEPRPANLSWISGDQIYLTRITPSIENMNDASKYEFFSGYDGKAKPVWTKDFDKIKPILDWNNHCGCVTITYNAPLKKYLMCVTDGWPTMKEMSSYIMESDQVTGPWKMVTYLSKFGEQAYFLNIPSKFISKDGRSAWLCYSANFTNGYMGTRWKSNPPGSSYAMCLQEIKLLSSPAPKSE